MGKKKKEKKKPRKRVNGRRGPSTIDRIASGPYCWGLKIGGRREPLSSFHCVWIKSDSSEADACRALSQKIGIQGPSMMRLPHRDKDTK